MILKVTEQNGITIVEFVDVTRFTLASADEVKTELRPLLNNKDCRMLFDFHDIEFVIVVPSVASSPFSKQRKVSAPA